MRKSLKILTLIMVVALATAVFAGCGTKSGDDNTFKVGMECGYAPFNWTQKDGSNGGIKISGTSEYAGGYDVEIAKKIADGLGKELVIVKTEWNGLLPALTSGKIDAIIAGMSPTEERKKSIDFSENYYTSDLVVVIKKDGKYASAKSINDFDGAKITGQLNTFHYTVIDQMKGVQKQSALEDFPTMLVALNSGKIDGYISERPGAISAMTTNPGIAYIAFSGDNGFEYDINEVSIAVGLTKNNENTAKINEVLKGITENDRQTLMETAVKNQPVAE